MKKNIIKAMVYVVVGITGIALAILAFAAMYLSGTFLPVYVGKTFVLGNRIIRTTIYISLLVFTILSAILADYGAKFLIKKIHKIRRR